MRALLVTVMVAAFAACSVLDDDLDKITFHKDGGGDSDGEGEGEACEVMVIDMLEMDGVCQIPDAECEGGVYPAEPSGTCNGALVCCIDTDQCEQYMGVLYCSDVACEDEGGPFGCPDNGWCCAMF
jgi:hypothetical protein